MVHTGLFATSTEITHFLPELVNSTYTAEAYINTYCACVESLINAESGYNWSDWYVSGTPNLDVKKILTLLEGVGVAAIVINNSKRKFFSESEAVNTIEYLEHLWKKAIQELQVKGSKIDWIVAGATP